MAEPSLSEREIDIMRQVVTGASNQEIARTLAISPNTVKVHLRNIYEKLGVASRTEATLVVLRQGIVAVEGVQTVEGAAEAKEPPPPESPPPITPLAHANGGSNTPLTLAAPAPPPMPQLLPPAHGARIPSWVTLLLGAAVVLLLILVSYLTLRPKSAVAPSIVVIEAPTRWRQLAALPAPRAQAVAVSVERDFLLVGGEQGGEPQRDVWRYRRSSGRWEAMAPLPIAVQGAPALLVGGDILVAGGTDVTGEPVDIVQRYKPESNRWVEEEARLPLPLARSALAAFEGTLFLFGGWDGRSPQSAVYRYLPDQATWEQVATLPNPRADLAAVTLPSGILLVGGTGARGEALDSILHFDPRETTEFRVEAPLPSAVAAPTVVTLGSALYLLGDEGFLEWDPEQAWKAIALPDNKTPAGAALVASDPYIILLGGASESQQVAEVWQYQAIFRSFIPIVPNNK